MKLKLKHVAYLIVFILILTVTANVNAEKISYGYVECDYRCGDNGEWNCHDRWSPKNSCKNESGQYVDTAEMHPNALGINIVDGHVQMVGSTDLFGKGTANYSQDIKVTHPIKIEKNTDDVWVIHDNSVGQTVYGLSTWFVSTYYIHDFRPLIEYINKTGKYPNYVVVSLTGRIGGASIENDIWAFNNLLYTYYPSDLMAEEHQFSFSNNSAEASRDRLEKIFFEDKDANGRLKREYCLRTDINETDNHQLWEDNCTYINGGQAAIKTTVKYYFALDLSVNADLNSCEDLDYYVENLKEMYKKDGATKSYTDLKNSINDYCEDFDNRVSSSFYVNTESKCFKRCHSYRNEMANLDPNFLVETNYCGFGKDMIGWLMRILKILRYIVPIIVIVVSITEYVGAIVSADDDAMKKVGARFSKRLLIMILIFILPSLLQLIFNIFNIDGLDKSNPYCLKF